MLVIMICLALLGFSMWYVPFRFARLCGLKRTWPLQVAVFLLMAGFLGMLQTGLYTSANPAIAAACNVLGFLFAFHIYLFVFLFTAHILSPFFKRITDKGIAVAGVLHALGIVGFGFIQAQSFTVTHHEIEVRGITQPVNIMHISDLHLGAQRKEGYLKKVIEAVRQHQSEIVLYNGDMLDSDIVLTPELFALFESIDAEQYFIIGNHEFYIDTAKALQLIAGAGIHILRNEMTETHGIQLIGMEYMSADRATFDSHKVNDLTIEEELPKIARDESRPSVLVHHSPVGAQYVSNGNIDVMLSGHTHGGQMFPGTALIGFLFPRNKGRYQIGETTLLVSQGTGTFATWMRIGSFNEIQLVKLIPKPLAN